MPDKKYKYERVYFTYEGKQYEASGRTVEEAAKKAALKEAALKRGEIGLSPKMTVRRWVEEWLATYKKPNVTEKVFQDYQRKLGFVTERIGSRRLKDVKDIELQQVLNEFAGYSDDYVRSIRQLIQGLFRQARISRLIVYDPAEALVLPKVTHGSYRSITDEERAAILPLADTHRAGPWIKMLLYCGLRPGETRALRWIDIDFDTAKVHVRSAMESGSTRIKDPKSAAGVRSVPIPLDYLQELKALKKRPYDPVFTQQTSSNAHTESSMKALWRSFKRALDISMGAKLYRNKIVLSLVAPDLVPYCLRHTYGTDLQRSGVPINVARYLMGHSDISVTSAIYTDTTDDVIEDAARKMGVFYSHFGT